MQLKPVPPIPGVTDFASLLDFLKNQEMYESRVLQLEALRVQIEDGVQRLIGAEEVDVARNQARVDRNMAAEELRHARSEIKRMTADAYAERDAALAETKLAREALESAKCGHDRARRVSDEALREREHALSRAQAALEQQKAETIAARKAAESIREEFQAKLATLKARVAEVS